MTGKRRTLTPEFKKAAAGRRHPLLAAPPCGASAAPYARGRQRPRFAA